MPEVVNAKISAYKTHLREPSRPPSKGGNGNAKHQHVVTIGEDVFFFFSLGALQWVFVTDTVSFSYSVSARGHKIIDTDTLVTTDKDGKKVVRGNRGSKPYYRTAVARAPTDRRF